ncbi:hypothetical protein BpHYR1_028882, partial [Brachionus plicatilis]
CEPSFGVFAPSHKVQLEKSNEVKASSKAIASSTPKSGAKLSALTKKHSGSQESIISEKSSISTTSAPKKNSTQRKSLLKQFFKVIFSAILYWSNSGNEHALISRFSERLFFKI